MPTKMSTLERVLRVFDGRLPHDLARQILDVGFTDTERARTDELSEKAQAGTLTNDERAELEDLATANDFLTILQAKARIALSHRSSAV